MGRLRRLALALLGLWFGAAGPARSQSEEAARRLVRELIPQVERAVGLTFKRAPVVAVRTREQLRRYLERKVATDIPAADLAGSERAYKAFGLIPDTLDLRRMMLDVLEEQVAGFYDPDSQRLFLIRGGDPSMLRLVAGHELVHALQDQYFPLSPVLKMRRSNDRQTAAQAVMEGQATLAMFLMQPGADLEQLSELWPRIRQLSANVGAGSVPGGSPASMASFARAPRILRDALIFPYIYGAEFMINYERRRARAGEMPYGDALPVSTEQILHPSAYTGGQHPARLLIGEPVAGDTAVYEDDFGEFEMRVALETWGIGAAEATAAASGWHGDRYRVLGTRAGTALIWVSAWDTPDDAAEFEAQLRRGWESWSRRRAASGRRYTIERLTVGGVPVVRLVDAPQRWSGWNRLPVIRVRS